MTLSPADLRAQANSPWDDHTPTPIRHLTDEKIDALLVDLDIIAACANTPSTEYTYGLPLFRGSLIEQALRTAVHKWYYQHASDTRES